MGGLREGISWNIKLVPRECLQENGVRSVRKCRNGSDLRVYEEK